MPDVKAVVQAGGRGTRLAPYSTVLPKALMPVGDGTVIDHLLEQFAQVGVQEVAITVSKHGPLIRSYCGDGSRWDLSINYVVENEPLGTIGPLRTIADQLDGPFFVTNSDVYTDLELKDVLAFHESHRNPLTVVVTPQIVSIPYGVLKHSAGKVEDFQEKPTEQFFVSTGIYCMSPEIFEFIPESGPFGFDQLMRTLLESGTSVNAFEHTGRWIDIGRVEDLRRAQEHAAGLEDDE
jgi:NDP-mannose synthase